MKNIVKISIRFLGSILFYIPYLLYNVCNSKPPIFQSNNKRFVGYFNRFISCNNNILLCGYSSLSDEFCDIIEYNLITKEETQVTATRFFNPQVGANAQYWRNNIVFNDIDDHQRVVTKIRYRNKNVKTIRYGLLGDISQVVDKAILYDCAEDRFFNSDYGPNSQTTRILRSKIYIVCLKSSLSSEVIIDPDCNSPVYYQNFLWNTDGNIFCAIKRGARMEELVFWKFCSVSSNWVILDRYQAQYISHFCWLNESSLLCFLKTNSGKEAYHTFSIEETGIQEIVEANGKRDGHPVCNKGHVFTDTYPGVTSMIQVYELPLSDTRSVTKSFLWVYHPFWLVGRYRCDSHLNVAVYKTKDIILIQRAGIFGRFVEGYSIE